MTLTPPPWVNLPSSYMSIHFCYFCLEIIKKFYHFSLKILKKFNWFSWKILKKEVKILKLFHQFLLKILEKFHFLRKCLWSFEFYLLLWLFRLFTLRFRNVSLLVILKNYLISLCFLQNNYINFKNIITSKKIIYLEKKGAIRSQFSFYDDTKVFHKILFIFISSNLNLLVKI